MRMSVYPHPVAQFPRLRVTIPMFDATVQAGFPSPAEGYAQKPIDLNELLISNPPSTFMFRAVGQSMIFAPIRDGDWVVVDRSLEATDQRIVLACIDGEFTVKRLRQTARRVWLEPDNPEYPNIYFSEAQDAVVWGVVKGSISVLL